MEPLPLQQVERTYVRDRGAKLSYFAGCDYFRMSSHPKIQKAMVDGLRKFGGNVAASRLTTGNHILYIKVEAALRQFFDAPSALVVSNGYVTNLIVAQALAADFTHAFIDSRAHLSLRDAGQFLRCPMVEFAHGNAAALARAIKTAGRKVRPIILTDGLFSHDGEIAPLARYLEILPKNGLVLLDDAHGAGVLGKNGRGTLEYAGTTRTRVIQTITLSKAFGVYGGAILCSRELRERILAQSRMFAGSTPPPLPLMNAALQACRLLRGNGGFLRRLNANVSRVKNALRQAGYIFPNTPSPILAVVPKDTGHAAAIRKALLARRIFPSFIKYSGGLESGYFRLTLSSEHSAQQLDNLIMALKGCHD